MKVLVAEDDGKIRRVLASLLTTWGFEPVMAEHGAAAWQILQQETPQLVILDWMMPELDGLEFLRRLRALSLTPSPYVLMLTCRGGTEDTVAALEAGANDFVSKPFEAEELKARLRVGERVVRLQQELADRVIEMARQRQEVARRNRDLGLLHETGQALAQASSEQELLQSICRSLVESGGYRLAWAGYPERGKRESLQPLAVAGNRDTRRLSWGGNPTGSGPAGIPSRTGQPAVSHDVQDPYFAPRNPTPAGYAAVIALPLVAADRVFGELVIYADDPFAFSDEETALLSRLAAETAYGIASLRNAIARQRAEEELLREHARAQQYLDVAGVLMLAVDGEGRITLINRKGSAILGWREEELLGRDWFESCFANGTRKHMRHLFERLMAGEPVANDYHEEPVLIRSGTERILAFHHSVIRHQDGEACGVLFSGQDVTEQRRAEEALRESERNYRAL
ncbi:MAG TPA: response regulator, partial [Geobacterales bacterium]|nr:response regulator [Geobacterales bacterium]